MAFQCSGQWNTMFVLLTYLFFRIWNCKSFYFPDNVSSHSFSNKAGILHGSWSVCSYNYHYILWTILTFMLCSIVPFASPCNNQFLDENCALLTTDGMGATDHPTDENLLIHRKGIVTDTCLGQCLAPGIILHIPYADLVCHFSSTILYSTIVTYCIGYALCLEIASGCVFIFPNSFLIVLEVLYILLSLLFFFSFFFFQTCFVVTDDHVAVDR